MASSQTEHPAVAAYRNFSKPRSPTRRAEVPPAPTRAQSGHPHFQPQSQQAQRLVQQQQVPMVSSGSVLYQPQQQYVQQTAPPPQGGGTGTLTSSVPVGPASLAPQHPPGLPISRPPPSTMQFSKMLDLVAQRRLPAAAMQPTGLQSIRAVSNSNSASSSSVPAVTAAAPMSIHSGSSGHSSLGYASTANSSLNHSGSGGGHYSCQAMSIGNNSISNGSGGTHHPNYHTIANNNNPGTAAVTQQATGGGAFAPPPIIGGPGPGCISSLSIPPAAPPAATQVASTQMPLGPTNYNSNSHPSYAATPNVPQQQHQPNQKPTVVQQAKVVPILDPKDQGPKQLIINYLAPEVQESELFALFEQFGPLQCVKIMLSQQTGLSKGFGFVYFASSADAATSMKQLQGFELYGKYLRVGYAVPQRPPNEGWRTASTAAPTPTPSK